MYAMSVSPLSREIIEKLGIKDREPGKASRGVRKKRGAKRKE